MQGINSDLESEIDNRKNEIGLLKKYNYIEYFGDFKYNGNSNGLNISINNNLITVNGTANKTFGINIFKFEDNKSIKNSIFKINETYKITILAQSDSLPLPYVQVFYANSNNTNTELVNSNTNIGTFVFTIPDEEFTDLQFNITFINRTYYSAEFYLYFEHENILTDRYTQEYNQNINNTLQYCNNYINNIKNFDLFSYLINNNGESKNGVDFTINTNNEIIINGSPTRNTGFNFINNIAIPIYSINPGDTINFEVDFDIDENGVMLQVLERNSDNTDEVELLQTRIPGKYSIKISDNAYSIRCNIVVVKNYMFNNFKVKLKIVKQVVTETTTIINQTEKLIYRTSEYDGSLIRTVKEAIKQYGRIVLLDNTNYDMVQEFIDYYGESFFTNYSTGQNSDGWGLEIGNGITLKGLATANIICDPTNYETSSNNIHSYFSPLMLSSDCTLENLNIYAQSCKYCVHDDWYNKQVAATHIYKNCNIHSGSNVNRCIGGGLQISNEIIIKDCIFESDRAPNPIPVHYHNCILDNAKSRIVISGNYFKNGGCAFQHYGASTLKTEIILSNNSWMMEPYINYVNQTQYPNENMEIVANWNNVLRG